MAFFSLCLFGLIERYPPVASWEKMCTWEISYLSLCVSEKCLFFFFLINWEINLQRTTQQTWKKTHLALLKCLLPNILYLAIPYSHFRRYWPFQFPRFWDICSIKIASQISPCQLGGWVCAKPLTTCPSVFQLPDFYCVFSSLVLFMFKDLSFVLFL